MLTSLKNKINSALQEASIITENLQQQYRQRVTTPDTSLSSSQSTFATSTLDLGLPSDVNVAAGCNLLTKYEGDWKIIHQNNVENSIKAHEVAKQIQTIESRITSHHQVLTDLIHCLVGIPNLVAKLKICQETLDDVHHLSQTISNELENLENVCEEFELQEYILEKQCEISKYKQKKMEDLEVHRQKIAAEHQQRIKDHEKNLRKVQKERQAVFDDAFRHDLEEFKQKGHIPKIHSSLNQEVTLEEVVLDDTEGKDALEDFLNGESLLLKKEVNQTHKAIVFTFVIRYTNFRIAVEELMKEMNEYKDKEISTTERKKNPLGKPNKLFLGRTINSMMSHNKRQNERNMQRCERKLKELDAKQKKHEFKRYRRDYRSKSDSTHEVISSDSSDEVYTNNPSKKQKKKKKKRRKKKQRSSSSSSTTSRTQKDSSADSSDNLSSANQNLNRTPKRYKKAPKREKYGQEHYNEYANDISMGYYVDPHIAYAAIAYDQMNHIMQQQQIVQQQIAKKELGDGVEIPSDLSTSWQSSPESSLNVSLNSSSAEEDENGILTFKLSSEDEQVARISQKVKKKATKINEDENTLLYNEEIDKDSVHSHISLESKDSEKSRFKDTNIIYLLSSSCSDSEELEIVETITENINSFPETNGNIR